MRMISIRRAFAGIGAGLITLLTATTPSAQAAPTPTHPLMASVCDTGYRGQPAYDHACLTHGTPKDAARLWNAVPEGKRGQEHDDYTTQRGICRYAHRHGGIMTATRELTGDVTYDTYRNNEQVNRWAGQDATLTCAQLGYRI
jgi:hypothetical protein